MATSEQRPVRLIVRDDLARTRLTVVFRLVLVIPLFVWVVLRGIAAAVVGFVNWLAVLIQGEVPDSLHGFVASYIRYSTQVSAYVFLAADPYPWFRCQSDYPVDLEIDPPVRQGRWGRFFRLVLALPAIVIASVGSGLTSGSPSEISWSASKRPRGDALVERLLVRRRSVRSRPAAGRPFRSSRGRRRAHAGARPHGARARGLRRAGGGQRGRGTHRDREPQTGG